MSTDSDDKYMKFKMISILMISKDIYSINSNKLMSIKCKFKCDNCNDSKYKWMNSNSDTSECMKFNTNSNSSDDSMLCDMNKDSNGECMKGYADSNSK